MSDRKCKHELLEIDENNRVVKCAKCGRILDNIYGVGFDKNGVYITQRKLNIGNQELIQRSEKNGTRIRK